MKLETAASVLESAREVGRFCDDEDLHTRLMMVQSNLEYQRGQLEKSLQLSRRVFSQCLRAGALDRELIGFFGAEDTNPAPEDVKRIDAELTRLKKWHEFHTYNEAGHAFQKFASAERYRERAARASWTEMLAFFTGYLKRQS
jgi:hypothetical protein